MALAKSCGLKNSTQLSWTLHWTISHTSVQILVRLSCQQRKAYRIFSISHSARSLFVVSRIVYSSGKLKLCFLWTCSSGESSLQEVISAMKRMRWDVKSLGKLTLDGYGTYLMCGIIQKCPQDKQFPETLMASLWKHCNVWLAGSWFAWSSSELHCSQGTMFFYFDKFRLFWKLNVNHWWLRSFRPVMAHIQLLEQDLLLLNLITNCCYSLKLILIILQPRK